MSDREQPDAADAGGGRHGRLLVVDDEKNQREMLAAILGRAGFMVATAGDGAEALLLLAQERYDLLLTDQRMSGMDGIELLDRTRGRDPELPVVLMTAYGSVNSAVEAMKRGAADYLTKPFERDELLIVIDKVLRERRLLEEVATLRGVLKDRCQLGGIIGNSAAMQDVFSLIERIAHTDVPVLITGESGTGKELVARAIHQRSPRASQPFVALNCAAVPENLLESEFFGHERGAFTGATNAHPGRFEQANGGTLFLDEIGAMRIDLQAKLLRAIQEREVQRLGSTKSTPVDVHIVAATGDDLDELIQKRAFREDLYYRLNVVPIELPPLRDRPGDIPLLVDHFLVIAGRKFKRQGIGIDAAVLDCLQRHHWPGNVRELENCIERMVVLARGSRLVVEDLPDAVRTGPQPTGGGQGLLELPAAGVVLSDLEHDLIRQALARSRGSLAQAARLLGISYKTLQYRIRKYGLDREEFGE